MRQFLSFITILFLFYNLPALSQENDESLYDDFKKYFSKKYLNLGLLIQVGGKFQYEQPNGTNGFELTNFRLKLSGEFDKGIGYAVQTAFTRSPSILDAKVYYKISNAFIVDAGLFKSPFSREFLISAANIDFVNRAQLADLAPNRQIGVMARGIIPGTALNYSAGVFNGNRFTTAGNDNNDLLYAGRLSLNPDISFGGNNPNKVEIAVNFSQSNDRNVNIAGISPNYEGKRLLAGADTRFEFNSWLFTGEFVYGKFEPLAGEEFNPFAYQATLGYMFFTDFQGLLRWDSYKLDSDAEASKLVILGVNVWPTKISQFQINYIVPVNSIPKHHQLLVNAQVSF